MKLNGNDGKFDKRAPEPRREKRKGHRGLLVLGCVVLLLGALVAGYAIWERPPAHAAPRPTEPTAPVQPGQDDPTQPDAPPANADPDAPAPDEKTPAGTLSDHKDGVYTMLLVGRDAASNSTDTIIVGRFDTVNHTVDCVSIPRDTLINISWSNTPKKINAVYPGFINSGKDGVEGLRTHIANLLGFDVDCYAVVSMKAVEQVVDTIGGVWFDVPVDMDYEAPDQGLSIHIKAGYQLLDGENTVKVCRFRNTYAGGDMQRITVQQDVLKALASQLLTLGNIPNLTTLADIVVKNTDTNLTAANIAFFARQFLSCSMDNVTFQTVPISNGCALGGISFVSIDVPAWLEMVNARLSPFDATITEANVNILCADGTGTKVWATNGVVAGGEDSFYCLPCTVANGGKAVHHLPGACPNA